MCNTGSIIDIIEERFPVRYAMDWDNVGLLCGSRSTPVKKVYLAVDATDEVVRDAVGEGADLLITHHPLIFSGLKSVTDESFTGRRIMAMIKAGMSYYAMHTNYDVAGMAELSENILGFEYGEVLDVTTVDEDGTPQGIGRVMDVETVLPLTVKEIAMRVKERFSIETVKVFGDPESKVCRIAISPGSGKSMVRPALKCGAQVLITGDIDHHTGIDAVAEGLCIVDAGHYGVEKIFVEDMAHFLKKHISEITVLCAPVHEPFTYL